MLSQIRFTKKLPQKMSHLSRIKTLINIFECTHENPFKNSMFFVIYGQQSA